MGCGAGAAAAPPATEPSGSDKDEGKLSVLPTPIIESIKAVSSASSEERFREAEKALELARKAASDTADSSKNSTSIPEAEDFPKNGMEAWFSAEDYHPETKTWNDRGPNGHACVFGGSTPNVLDAQGNGSYATTKIRALSGDVNTQLDFGPVIKPAFTCASVTRYMGGPHARILQGSRSNWLHGHWGNHVGVAHYDGWKTDMNKPSNEDWALFIGQNGGEHIKRYNETDVSNAGGGSGDQRLVINQGAHGGEKSNFAVFEVITWNRHLSRQEIMKIEQYFKHHMATGLSTTWRMENAILIQLANCAAAARAAKYYARSAESASLQEGMVPPTRALEIAHEAEECFASSLNIVKKKRSEDAVNRTLRGAYLEQLQRALAEGELEKAARFESVPLKMLCQANVDPETVRKLVKPDELPLEFDLLQQIEGAGSLFALGKVNCTLCGGSGGDQTCIRKEKTTSNLAGALVALAAAKFSSFAKQSADCEALWLYETNAGGWDVYKPYTAKVLEQALSEGAGALVQVKGPRFEYIVDIGAMTQTNPETGRIRRMLRAVVGEDGCIELPSLTGKVEAKRRSCRYGSDCTRTNNSKHMEEFAHPEDDDYEELFTNETNEEKPRVAAWFFCDTAIEGGVMKSFDAVIAAHLENLHLSKALASREVIIRAPTKSSNRGIGDLRVNLESMTATAISSEKVYEIRRVFDDEDDEEVYDNNINNVVPSESKMLEESMEQKTTPCWVCHGTGQVSGCLSAEDISVAKAAREAEDGDAYTCLVCYGEGQYALSSKCGKHFFCADCIDGSLEAILASGQFPALCPMCRAEAMGDVESKPGYISEEDLSFLQHREVITKEFLFRFMRQAKQSEAPPGTEAKYFACPASCGRFCLEADPSYQVEPGSLFSLGMWQGEKFLGVEKQVPRLGACVCGAYVCVLCNQAEENAAAHVCPDVERRDAEDRQGLEALLTANIAKKCPNCPALIIKNEGCNFMTCVACKDPRGFCWETGKPRHGPSPPCCGGGHNCH